MNGKNEKHDIKINKSLFPDSTVHKNLTEIWAVSKQQQLYKQTVVQADMKTEQG
jgi:hypothetical protein